MSANANSQHQYNTNTKGKGKGKGKTMGNAYPLWPRRTAAADERYGAVDPRGNNQSVEVDALLAASQRLLGQLYWSSVAGGQLHRRTRL